MTTRRTFLQTAALGMAAMCGSTSLASAEDTKQQTGKIGKRPNFLFILCDDLGYGDLACFGNKIIATPTLDGLAGEGLKLTDCYAAAPVCSPSRAGAVSGRNPNRCGIRDWIPEGSPVCLRRGEPSAAALLKDAGYKTAHCGKWHLSGTLDGSQPTPGDHGFEYWFSTQNNALPSHQNPVNFVRNGKPVGPLKGYSSTLIVDEAVRWLKTVKDDPFCLFCWFHSPHEPVATAPEFTARYHEEGGDPTKAIYYGNVTQMDYETGRLLRTLDELGHRDDTFVIFTSDNGPETLNRYKGASHSHGSPGPLRGMKLHMYEGGIRVPGIIRWPGHVKPGTVSRIPVCGNDILPTFCELAKVPVSTGKTIDGTSFTPVLQGKEPIRQRPLYWRYDKALSRPKYAMRDGDWKILADKGFKKVELYNLAEDMGEKHDLAASHPEQVDAMLPRFKKIHQEIAKEGATYTF